MAKKFVRITVLAFALCVLLALSAFAYSTDLMGRVSGLEDGTEYTYAQYDFAANAYGEFAELTADTELTVGVWGIKAGDAEPEILFVSGTDSGYVNWYDNSTGVIHTSAFGGKVDGYVPGKWTVNKDSIYRTIGNYQNKEIILYVYKNKFHQQAQVAKTVTVENVVYSVYAVGETEYYLKDEAYYSVADNTLYEGEETPVAVTVGTWANATPIIGDGNMLQESVVSYGFANNQIIPANKVVEFKVDGMTTVTGAMFYNTKADGTKYTQSDVKGTFTWVVKNIGSAEETRYTIDIDATTTVFTAPAEMAESNGYLVAIEFAPYVNCPDDIFVGHPTDTSGECYAYINPAEGRNAVEFEEELFPAPTVYDGYGVIGYDSEFDVEIAPVTISADGTELSFGEWTDYEYDITAYRTMVGLYAVREKYNGKVSDYALAYAYGEKADRAALGQIDESTTRVATKTGGFVPGYWSNTKWAAGNNIATHSTFGTWYVGTLGGQVTATTTTTLKNAFATLAELKAAETPDEEAIAAAEKALLAAQTVVANQYSSANYTYAYEADEIINVNEANTYGYSWYQNNANVNFTTARVKLIAYVADREGNVTPYSIVKEHNYPNGATISGTFNFVDFLPEEGWIVAIQVYPCSDIAPEEVTEVKTTGAGRMLLNVDPATKYTILDAPELPLAGDKPEGIYFDKGVVKGFDANKRYAWAPFNLAGYAVTDWTILPEGITEYTFDREGAVAIMYAGDGYTSNGSEPTYVALGGSDDNIINLVTKNGDHTYKTIDSVKYYYYTIDGVKYYLKDGVYYADADGTEYTGENAESATPVYKSTKDVPETVYLANTDDNTYNVKFNEGKWSGLVLSNSLALNYSFNALCLGTTDTPIPNALATALKNAEAGTDAAALATARQNAANKGNNIYYSYAFKPEEVIKLSDFVSMDYRATMRQGGFKVNGSVQTKIVFKVIDNEGNLVDRVVYKPATYTSSGTKTTVYGIDLADVSGHLVGIVFYPYVLTEGSYYMYDGDGGNGDYDIYLYDGGYVVERTLDPADRPANIVFNGNKITGLDADETYYYGLYTINGKLGDWTTVTGVTEITHELTGLIGITIEGDGEWTGESEPVVGWVENDVAGRADIGNVTDSKPAYKSSQYWIPGTWTGDYLSWHDQVSGAYSFLDQTAGTNAQDVETLWLYQNTKEDVEAKLAADAALETLPNSWVNNNITSNPARLQAVIDTHYAAANYAETLSANKLALQTKIANAFATRNIAYALDETEILPVDELLSMSFSTKRRQGGLSFTSVRSKVVVHVMDANAEVTAYEWWSDEWSVTSTGAWKKITADIQSIENLPEEGWVVGIEFYPWADVEPSTIVANSDTRIDASNIAYSFTQQHVCIGYYPADYTVYIAAPEVEFDSVTGVISGLDANTSYQYMKYSVNGAGTAVDVEAGATTITLTEDGLYGVVSVVSGATSSPALVLFHSDAATTTTEIGTILDKGTYKVYDVVGGDVWEQGKWSGQDIGVHSSFGTYTLGSLGGHIAGAISKTLYDAQVAENAAAIETAKQTIVAQGNNVKFRYAYADDEIVPVGELLRISFKSNRRMGSLQLGEATAKVTFFVLNEKGTIEEYVWSSERYNAQTGASFSVLPSTIENWPTKGWVVAFQINPWSNLDTAGITATDGSAFNTMVNVTFVPADYTVLSGDATTETPVLALTSGMGIEVSNYNDLLTYVYSTDGGETWTEFNGGKFTTTKPSTAYVVKSLAYATYEESAVSEPITSRPIATIGSTLVLDGRIGTRVYLDIDMDQVEKITLHATKVNSDYSGVDGMSSEQRVYGNSNQGLDWISSLQYDEAKGLYYFQINTAAKDADNISIETQLNYTPVGGEEHVLGSLGFNFKVTSYIESAKALAAAGDAEFVAALPLIEALETYVGYADNYFGNGEDAAYASTASTEGVEVATRTNATLEGVAFYGTSLILEDQVTIRHYFTVEDLDAFTAAYDVAGMYGIKGDYIYFDIADIPAQEIGTVQTLTIADLEGNTVYEVNYSVANYIVDMMNDDDANLVSLVNAMYDYYLAAVEYSK